MADVNVRIEKYQLGLLSDRIDRRKKVHILRKLIELQEDARVVDVMREAAAAPVNGPVLSYIVRSMGYLKDPRIADDLAGYMRHPRRAVVRNAVKAAVSLDPARAVELVSLTVRTSPLRAAESALRVLADRCPAQAGPAFETFLRSREKRDRTIGLMYLRCAGGPRSIDLVLELLRTERDEGLVDGLFEALEFIASRADAPVLEKVRGELSARLVRLSRIIAELPVTSTHDSEEHCSTDSGSIRLRKGLAKRLAAASALPAAPPAPQQPVPDPLAAPPSAPETAAPAEVATPLLPWQEKEQRIRERHEQGRETAARLEAAGSTWPRVVRWLVCAAALVAAIAVYRESNPPPPPPGANRRPVDVAGCPLGRVNEKVRFVGQIVEVHRDYNVMLVRAGNTLASVRFDDSIDSFSPGRPVQIDGAIREISRGGTCVIDGSLAREP